VVVWALLVVDTKLFQMWVCIFCMCVGEVRFKIVRVCIRIHFLFGWYFCRSMYCVFFDVFVGGLGGG
jgi:hypothetical protein